MSRLERTRLRSSRPVTASGAFGWSLTNTFISRLGTLGIGVALARVLGPAEFGTFAIALVALMAVLSFNELGVSLAIVRWPSNPALIAPTVNTLSLLGSAIFCALSWAAAPLFTSMMGDPEATGVVRLLILSVLINGAIASPAALLQRDFQEKTRLVIDQTNVWSGAAISVVLALLGMGAMSLAVGRLAGGAISALMFLHASPLPYRLGWQKDKVVALLKFGLPLAGASIIVFAIGYADQIVAGSKIGLTALGFYVLAYNLASWPVNIVSQPLRRVAPAAFAAIQDDPTRLRNVILGLYSVLACATIPAFMALAGASESLVLFVYGEAWVPAAAALSWLVIAALSKVFCELAYDYIVVAGNTTSVLTIQVLGLVVLVPALFFGANLGGIAGLAAAQAVVSITVLMPLYLWQLRAAGVGLLNIVGRLWLPFIGGIIAGLICYLLASSMASVVLSLACGAMFTLLIIAMLLFFRRGDIQCIRNISRVEPMESES